MTDSLSAQMAELADEVMERCDELAGFSQSDTVIDRQYLTPQHKLANGKVANWMQRAGMTARIDAAGNVIGRYESSYGNAKRLLIGSHLDTVPNAGKYDGILGVIAPLVLVQHLNKSRIRFPYHLDIVGFCDEEGARFGTTLLGSRALAGTWQSEWDYLRDNNGVTLRKALFDFGLNFEKIWSAKLENTEEIIGFLEWHIEQGPVLEAEDLPVGVVTAIAGARRIMFDVSGFAGHAGTVPMDLRQDALAATAEMILKTEAVATETGVLATVGRIGNFPNGVNVIPGRSQFTVDIRSGDDQLRDQALQQLVAEFEQIVARRNLELTYKETHSASAVKCDDTLQQTLSTAVGRSGIRSFSLPSGAGHDAMAMSEICPVAMLFVRCEKGISHHPKESITHGDVAASLEVMHRTLNEIAAFSHTSIY